MFKLILYLLALAVAFYLLDLLLLWVFHRFIAPEFPSLTKMSTGWKIFMFIIAFVAFGYIYQFIQPIGMALAGLLGLLYPEGQKLDTIGSLINGAFYVINIIIGLIVLWRSPEQYNFWIVLALIYCSLIIWGVNSILAMTPKDREALQNR